MQKKKTEHFYVFNTIFEIENYQMEKLKKNEFNALI